MLYLKMREEEDEVAVDMRRDTHQVVIMRCQIKEGGRERGRAGFTEWVLVFSSFLSSFFLCLRMGRISDPLLLPSSFPPSLLQVLVIVIALVIFPDPNRFTSNGLREGSLQEFFGGNH